MVLVDHQTRGSDRLWRVAAIVIVAAASAARDREPVRIPARTLVEPPPGKLYQGVFPGGRNGRGGYITPLDVLSYEIRLAREEGAYNVRWVFHVDPWDEPVEEWSRFENYYPGDEWIDWVGVSVYGRQLPSGENAVSFRYPMDCVYARLRRLTGKPVIVCEFGTIDDSHQAAWAKAALADLVGRRWPKVIGFSWWNAAFRNDPATGRWSDMRVQESPALQAVFRNYVGRERTVISRPITRPVTLKEP
jgi:hypothetical protein